MIYSLIPEVLNVGVLYTIDTSSTLIIGFSVVISDSSFTSSELISSLSFILFSSSSLLKSSNWSSSDFFFLSLKLFLSWNEKKITANSNRNPIMIPKPIFQTRVPAVVFSVVMNTSVLLSSVSVCSSLLISVMFSVASITVSVTCSIGDCSSSTSPTVSSPDKFTWTFWRFSISKFSPVSVNAVALVIWISAIPPLNVSHSFVSSDDLVPSNVNIPFSSSLFPKSPAYLSLFSSYLISIWYCDIAVSPLIYIPTGKSPPLSPS